MRSPRVVVGARVVALFISKVLPKRFERVSAPALVVRPGPVMSFTKSDPTCRLVTVRAVVVAREVVEKLMSNPWANVDDALTRMPTVVVVGWSVVVLIISQLFPKVEHVGHVREMEEPPMMTGVPESERGPEALRVVVPTLESAFVPLP